MLIGGYVDIASTGGSTTYQAANPGVIQVDEFDGANLGVFEIGTTAVISSAASIVTTLAGEFADSSAVSWKVDSGSFSTLGMELQGNRFFTDPVGNIYDIPDGTSYNGLTQQSTNFLSGLGVGNHTLSLKISATTSSQTYSLDNNGVNYTAHFVITAAIGEA